MEENDKISAAWKEDNHKMRAVFEEDVKEAGVEWVSKLQEVKDRWQKRVSQLQQVAREKGNKIRQVTKKNEAHTEAHLQTLALLSTNEKEPHQSKKQWKDKCASLEESFREELVVKKSREVKVQELEEMWLIKQEEWIQRASKAEEEIKVLIVQKNTLQKKGKKKGSFWSSSNCRNNKLLVTVTV